MRLQNLTNTMCQCSGRLKDQDSCQESSKARTAVSLRAAEKAAGKAGAAKPKRQEKKSANAEKAELPGQHRQEKYLQAAENRKEKYLHFSPGEIQ